MNHRALVGLLLLVSLVLSIYSASTIRARFQFRDFYDYPANPHLPLFKRDTQEFGDPAGYVVAMIEAKDVFRRDVLEYVQRLTTTLEPEPVFSRVRSLTNVSAIRGQGDDVVTGPMLSAIPETPAALAELRRFAMDSPLLRRRLISNDGTTTAVLAEMKTPSAFANVAEQREAIEAMRRALAKNPPPPGVDVRLTGAPTVEVGVTEALIHDQLLLMPAVLLVLGAMLFFTFRSFHGILLCMASVGVATLWAAGVFGLLGRPVDIIGSVIPTTILVYGVVDPIFVLTRVLHKLEAGRSKDDAIVEALSELALPCFVTSLTTAFGFAAFLTSDALTIRYYGLSVAAGVLFAWLTSVTVLPLLLSLAPLPKRRFSAIAFTQSLDRALSATWRWLKERVPQAIAVTAIALVGSAYLAREQEVNNVYVGALPNGDVLRDTRAFEQKLTGVLRVIVYLEGPADAMKQPAVLKAIEKVDISMEKQRLVTLSSSLADLVAEANQAFQGGDVRERKVPESSRLIAQYLALVAPGDRADFVTDDFSRSHIALLLEDAGSKATREVVALLERAVADAGFDRLGVKASLTGNGVAGYSELDGMVTELVYGFLVAFAVIVLVQWIAFRSLRIALISVVPNLLPVIACFLTLRALSIDLRIDSALVLCISIGGLFNTTIHFAARVRQRIREVREPPDEVILHALRAIGPPALFTAATLSVGFAVLLLSRFPGLQQLGLLSMITLLSGAVSDMTVTAVLMRAGLDWKAVPSNATPLAAAATPD